MKTDEELRHDVQAELNWDPRFDARDVGVFAKDGVVTLDGKVSSCGQRNAAEEAAARVAGVRAIANEIRVELHDFARRDDTELATATLTALRSDVRVPAANIKAIVRNGWVTLEGEVSLRSHALAAERVVQNLWGVRGVANYITISAARPTLTDVKAKIEDAFRRHAQLDADAIQIGLEGATVILTGEVRSLRERKDAEIAAWSAPGITNVENRLHVQI